LILPVYWVNGEQWGELPPNDRGFTYGDSLFETLRCHEGRAHLWNYHWQRLERGMKILGFYCSRDRIEALLELGKRFLAERDIDDAAARLTISRGAGRRGYGAGSGDPTLVLSLDETTVWRGSRAPIQVTLCSTRLAEQPALAGIKHGNRLEQVLAARELEHSAADDGLQLDYREQLICAVSANLFVAVDGELLTPAVDRCGIAGTVRRLVLEELAPAVGIPHRVTDVTLEQLGRAEELFLTNAVAGIRNVARCDQHAFTSTHCGDTLRSEFYTWAESTAW
jgi:4-amino-4-deoxychorismate lyase